MQHYGKHELIWWIIRVYNIGKIFLKILRIYIYLNRDIANTLANDNDTLRGQMRQTEKDTIDVVTFLKKQDLDKDIEVKSLMIIKNKIYFGLI